MHRENQLIVFGEVLADCFPGGEQVLGGAPFNVAWHLQAFADQPQFISRVGDDQLGASIIKEMKAWGMQTTTIQIDKQHVSGRVDVELVDNEPHYNIVADCAYDFIESTSINLPNSKGILYHGSLALRSPVSRHSLESLACNENISIFLDVNLRPPWWKKDEILAWLKRARWAKLNRDELAQLMELNGGLEESMAQFQEENGLELLIVTCGGDGAVVRDVEGELHRVSPRAANKFVDTVGAGDAFTAVFLHGLMSGWPVVKTLNAAQDFASAVVGLRGATCNEKEFYQQFYEQLEITL